jgi:putative ABC transport system permease protein
VNYAESFRIAFRALAANKARSLLTMLGVIIGVAAVIMLVGIGTGVQDEVTGSLEGLGSNLLFIMPGQYGGGLSGAGGGPPGRKLTLEDMETIQRSVTGLKAIAPVLSASATIKAGNRDMRVSVSGSNGQAPEVFANKLLGGRNYLESEVQAASRVIGLGYTVATTLFPNQDPVGKQVTLNGQRFTVVGYYGLVGGGMAGDQDSQVYIPVTTAQKLFNTNDLTIIVAKAADPADIDRIRAEIKRVLTPTFGDEFSVFSQDQTLGILSDLLGMLTYMLAGIAGISLLVGGIGIMNIMLATVTERTREIGIRRALGAKRRDITQQFLIETIVLSGVGGLLGVCLGISIPQIIIYFIEDQKAIVTGSSVLLSFGISVGIGILFGLYPARRAALMDPIEALRHE